MGFLARTFWMALIYASFATVITAAGAMAYFHFTVGLDSERSLRAWAALNGVDVATIEAEAQADVTLEENTAHEDLLEVRVQAELERDLREQSIRQGLHDLNLIRDEVATERRRYKLLKDSFDAQLASLESTAKDDAVLEVQQTLQAIKPKLAKDHLIRMLPPGFTEQPLDGMNTEDRDTVYDVVAMMKAMQLDKRKKILEEFKSEDEADVLAELLRLIRLGVPELELIGDARKRLEEFQSN